MDWPTLLLTFAVGVAVGIAKDAIVGGARAAWRRLRGKNPALEHAQAKLEAELARQQRKDEAAETLSANVQRANDYLRQLVNSVERWSEVGHGLHEHLEECRQEFLRLRPGLAVLRERDIVERIGAWYEDVKRTCDEMERTFKAWMQAHQLAGLTSTPVPASMMTSPIVEKVKEYKHLLNLGMGHANMAEGVKRRVAGEGKGALGE